MPEAILYKVHSTVSKVHTRVKRMRATGPQKRAQKFVGGTITVRRERPATITEAQLLEHLDAFKKAQQEGRIEVRTITRQLVDLNTLKAAPLPVVPPKPHPLLDSVARDTQNVGEKMPTFMGGKAVDQQVTVPELSKLIDDKPVEDFVGGDPVLARQKARHKKAKSEV